MHFEEDQIKKVMVWGTWMEALVWQLVHFYNTRHHFLSICPWQSLVLKNCKVSQSISILYIRKLRLRRGMANKWQKLTFVCFSFNLFKQKQLTLNFSLRAFCPESLRRFWPNVSHLFNRLIHPLTHAFLKPSNMYLTSRCYQMLG